MTREEHLKKIMIVGTRKLGKSTALVMLCSGPECGGAEMLSRCSVGDAVTAAGVHIATMDALKDLDVTS